MIILQYLRPPTVPVTTLLPALSLSNISSNISTCLFVLLMRKLTSNQQTVHFLITLHFSNSAVAQILLSGWHQKLLNPYSSLIFVIITVDTVIFLLLIYSVHTTSIACLSIPGEGSRLCCSSWDFFSFFPVKRFFKGSFSLFYSRI